MLVWLVCRMFPSTGRSRHCPSRKRVRRADRKNLLAAILALAVAGFATDTLHGISPAWISLAARHRLPAA
ncbi:hypothetical protein ACU4GH_15310 [Bradyrhizobium betae]